MDHEFIRQGSKRLFRHIYSFIFGLSFCVSYYVSQGLKFRLSKKGEKYTRLRLSTDSVDNLVQETLYLY